MSNLTHLTNGLSFVTSPSNPAERTAKEVFLRGLNPVNFSRDPAYTAQALRSMAVGMLPHTTENGKRMSKTRLIAELSAYITASRKALEVTLSEHLSEKHLSTNTLDGFYAGLMGDTSIDDLATYLLNQLAINHHTEISLLKTGVPNLLHALLIDPRLADRTADVERVGRAIRYRLKDSQVKIKADYTEAVKSAHQNQIPIAYPIVLDWATEKLTNPVSWKEVTYALALVTGRRMGELLGDHSRYYWEGDCLMFVGILKTAGLNKQDVPVQTSPIVDPSLVLSAFDWLTATGKRVPHTKVNSRYSKALSTEMTLSVTQMRLASGLPGEFKASRDFYAAYSADVLYDRATENQSVESFVMSRLHHNDLVTTSSYRKYRMVTKLSEGRE